FRHFLIFHPGGGYVDDAPRSSPGSLPRQPGGQLFRPATLAAAGSSQNKDEALVDGFSGCRLFRLHGPLLPPAPVAGRCTIPARGSFSQLLNNSFQRRKGTVSGELFREEISWP